MSTTNIGKNTNEGKATGVIENTRVLHEQLAHDRTAQAVITANFFEGIEEAGGMIVVARRLPPFKYPSRVQLSEKGMKEMVVDAIIRARLARKLARDIEKSLDDMEIFADDEWEQEKVRLLKFVWEDPSNTCERTLFSLPREWQECFCQWCELTNDYCISQKHYHDKIQLFGQIVTTNL